MAPTNTSVIYTNHIQQHQQQHEQGRFFNKINQHQQQVELCHSNNMNNFALTSNHHHHSQAQYQLHQLSQYHQQQHHHHHPHNHNHQQQEDVCHQEQQQQHAMETTTAASGGALLTYSMYSYDLNDEFSDILSAPSTPEPCDIYTAETTDQLVLSCDLIYQQQQQQQQQQQPQQQQQQQQLTQIEQHQQPQQETCSVLMQSMWQPLSPPESSHYEGASPRSSYSVATPASSYCSASPSPPISSYLTTSQSTTTSSPYLFNLPITRHDANVIHHHHHGHNQQQQQQHQSHQMSQHNQQQQRHHHHNQQQQQPQLQQQPQQVSPVSKCGSKLASVKIENTSTSETRSGASDLVIASVVATHHHVPHHRSSPIHLWEFLKELLQQQQQQQQQSDLAPNSQTTDKKQQDQTNDGTAVAAGDNGTNTIIIRWLDRQEGVFKIEDSVRVAKLWGKRKNKPKMNYDKLSRSIRQYYKKGIMKKTDRSQRLVYQFCPAYCQ